jgi:molecular chaperone GrpE (heat shock protein)
MKSVLLSILDVTDAFEEVFSVIDGKKDEMMQSMRVYVANFRTRYRMLRGVLSERQVVQIENIGERFDPYWHHAVDHVEDASKEDGAIVRVIKKGYFWKDQVLRKVWVIVVRNPK